MDFIIPKHIENKNNNSSHNSNNNCNSDTNNNNCNSDTNNIIIDIDGHSKVTNNLYKFNTITYDGENIFLLNNIANTYKFNGDSTKALEIFEICKTKITENDPNYIVYDININIALLYAELNYAFYDVFSKYEKVINLFPDRAEPYFYFGLYCNQHKFFGKSYEILTKALNVSYEKAKAKYNNIQDNSYGKFLYDELAVACYWLHKYEEAKEYIEKIINDPDFEHVKERLNQNLIFINSKTK